VIVGKLELASLLRTTHATLDRWIVKFGDSFPVIERGRNGKPWQFDAEAVMAFLHARREEEDAKRAERDEQLAQLMLPLPGEDQQQGGGASIDDRLKAARLSSIMMENARKAAELVPAAKVREGMEMAIATMGRTIDDELRLSCAEHGIPLPVRELLERRFAEARRRAVAEVRAALSEPEPEQPPPLLAT